MNLLSNNDYFRKPIKVVAHRGDSKFYPENSKPAFQSAIDLGVDIIETDVHISSDGVIFVWHDDNTEKIDGSLVPIYERSWQELSALDSGIIYTKDDGSKPFAGQGLALMKFEDVLKDFPEARFNVDLKDEREDLVKGFYRILEENDAFDRVVVASFSTDNLKGIRKLSERVITSYGRSEVKKGVVLSKLGLLSLLGRFIYKNPLIQVPVTSGKTRVVTQSYIKALHKIGVKIQVWTINDEDEMRRLLDMGVDGIMTDDPRLLLKVIS